METHYFTGFKTKLEKVECWVMGERTSFARQTRAGLWEVVIYITKLKPWRSIIIERYKQEAIWLLRLHAARAIKRIRQSKREIAAVKIESAVFMDEAFNRDDRREFVPAPSYYKKPKATKPDAYVRRKKAYLELEF